MRLGIAMTARYPNVTRSCAGCGDRAALTSPHGRPATRERLSPDVFRLPVEQDPRRATTPTPTSTSRRSCSRTTGRHPRVLMQVFQKNERSVLGGIDEAIAVLKQCAGARAARRRRGRPAGTSSRCSALYEGDAVDADRDRHDDRGRLRAVRPPRDRLPRLARAPLAGDAQRARASSRPRTASRSCSSPPATTTGSCRPATAGPRTSPGAIGVSTDAQASWWGGRGVGTVPHALIAAFGGDTVAAARAFADRYARRDERHRARRLRQRLRAHGARGGRRARRQALGRAPGHLGAARRPRRSGTRWATSARPA